MPTAPVLPMEEQKQDPRAQLLPLQDQVRDQAQVRDRNRTLWARAQQMQQVQQVGGLQARDRALRGGSGRAGGD